jgi:sugar lactone lactonase YvrE
MKTILKSLMAATALIGGHPCCAQDNRPADTQATNTTYTFTALAGLAGSKGTNDGTGNAARFTTLQGVAVDRSGNVFVADEFGQTIRKVTPAGVVTTLAGLTHSPGTNDGTGSAARFVFPQGVAVDGGGNVYVAEWAASRIRKIAPDGIVTGIVRSPASTASNAGAKNAARYNRPMGLAADSAGNVYLGDVWHHTIGKVTPTGTATTLAGLAGEPGSTDGAGSVACFNQPSGVAVDSPGSIYVADSHNHTIRKVTPAGVVTTLAGLAGSAGTNDGSGSAARFNFPTGVAVDGAGNLYVADYRNHTIRSVTPAGMVTTMAGTAGTKGSSDGSGSGASFNGPTAVAVDSAGNLYVVERFNPTLRKGVPAVGRR